MARCNATETGRPRYDGKVGSSVAGRLQVVASQAEALRLWRSRDEDVVQMARKALMERTNGLLGCWAAVAARAVAAARGQFSLFSTAFLLFSSSPA